MEAIERDICTAPARVLVVEDEDHLRTILRIQLEQAGYRVITASDGEEGLRLAIQEKPDLIILDWMMPRMDGYEVCHRLKSHFVTSHIPIIMLTAKAELSDKLKSLSDGANDYIVKPYAKEELILRVRNLLTWSRSQRDANPLTGLPGNVVIEQEFQRRMAEGQDFAFLYVDMDHFKAFNDYYGYRRGDAAIRMVADLLLEVVHHHGTPTDFVGHVGGDDFVVIADPATAPTIAEVMIEEFDRRIPQLYDPEDRRRGYIEVRDRQGKLTRFPIITLTIAAVHHAGRSFRHVGEICDVSAELKQYGKRQEGSVVVWERRGAR
jgi:diguanylate cyclase (GGDEF)-like protein